MRTDEAVAWAMNAHRRMVIIARHGNGAARAVALTWIDEFELAERRARERGDTERDIPLREEWGPLVNDSIERAGTEFRESGDSIPAECPCGEGKNPLHAFLNCGQAPPLNKSGGSGPGVIADVMTLRCPTCHHEFTAAAIGREVASLRCPKCGQTGRPKL